MADQQPNNGLFLPTSSVFDVSQIYETEVTSPEFKELLVRLYQSVNNISVAMNYKVTGYFPDRQEIVTSAAFFPASNNDPLNPSPEYCTPLRNLIINPGVNVYPHNITITATTTFTEIYGVANDTVGFNYFPLPFASAAGLTNIELKVDNVNVTITNNSGITFNIGEVILKYLKY